MLRKTALTAYGVVGTEIVRATAALNDKGQYIVVRADGHNAVIGTLPTVWRTSGDVVSVAATMVDTYHIAALPASLPAHTWKTTYSLEEIAEKFIGEGWEKVVAGLKATYSTES